MKYNETDLTEAIKIVAYLRSLRIYAVTIAISALIYLGMGVLNNVTGAELYLLYCLTGVVILGSLSFIVRPNHKTANIYGLSCIASGAIFSFCIFYYRSGPPGFFTAVGLIVGLIVIRHGMTVGFGPRSREAFSRAGQKRASFARTLMKSLKRPSSNDDDTIHCTYTDETGGKKNLSIKLLDGVACFLLSGHSTPVFFDRKNVYFSELQGDRHSVEVSILAYDHDWLEAQLRPADFKRCEEWKNL